MAPGPGNVTVKIHNFKLKILMPTRGPNFKLSIMPVTRIMMMTTLTHWQARPGSLGGAATGSASASDGGRCRPRLPGFNFKLKYYCY